MPIHPVPQVLEVGSMVQFGDPVQYGVIKVIKKDSITNVEVAEIEIVSSDTTDYGYICTCTLNNSLHTAHTYIR